MKKYRIFTDGACDLSPAWCQAHNVMVLPMYYSLASAIPEAFPGNGMFGSKQFYDILRKGTIARTAAPGIEDCKTLMRPVLSDGTDILYIGLSSGLSGTYNVVRLAALELREEFPDRQIVVPDSGCGSLGEGLLVELVNAEREKGMPFAELCSYAGVLRKRIRHEFTVNDLMYLKRGGRISGGTAFAGTMLQIMPLMHLGAEGKLESVGKVRGRKAALRALAERTAEGLAADMPIYVGHCDAEEDARHVREMLRRYCANVTVREIGPVIGAHGGPGTVAVFSVGI